MSAVTVDNESHAELIAQFTAKIAAQEERLYGLALFFECICLLYAGQEGILSTYRKQFRNLIQEGRGSTSHVTELLAKARDGNDAEALAALKAHPFSLFQTHPHPQELIARAELVAAKYGEIFPGRDRSKDFSDEERLKLIDAAAAAFVNVSATV